MSLRSTFTDDNGNVLDNLAFEAFGSRKAKDWTTSIPATELDALLALQSGHTRKSRGFTGHEHLDRTGFIHMNGRVYDPVLGRFLSPDPLVQFPTFSQRWNRYSYVNNAPTSFTDPTGYFGNETMEEIVVTGSRGSTLGSSNSMLHAMGSLSVSNGGGVGSGGGLAAGRFGEGATAPSEAQPDETGESGALCTVPNYTCSPTDTGVVAKTSRPNLNRTDIRNIAAESERLFNWLSVQGVPGLIQHNLLLANESPFDLETAYALAINDVGAIMIQSQAQFLGQVVIDSAEFTTAPNQYITITKLASAFRNLFPPEATGPVGIPCGMNGCNLYVGQYEIEF